MSARDYTVLGETLHLSVQADGDGRCRVRVATTNGALPEAAEAREIVADARALGDGALLVRCSNRQAAIRYAADGPDVWVFCAGRTFFLKRAVPGRARSREHSGDLAAPMPGLVIAVNVGVGEVVSVGRVLLVLEAMKMQHEVRAPIAGRVLAVHHATGDQVEAGAPLVELAPMELAPMEAAPQDDAGGAPAEPPAAASPIDAERHAERHTERDAGAPPPAR